MRLIEKEIEDLRRILGEMVDTVRSQMDLCAVAIENNSPDLIKKIKKKEKKVNKYDIEVEKKCERIIALFQPVALDLRFLFASIKANLYLEQIGDNFSSISSYLRQMEEPIQEKWIEKLYLREMIQRVKEIYEITVKAFFEADTELAKSVFLKDETIDRIHRYTQRRFAQFIKEYDGNMTEFIYIMAIVKHLEKVADHCVSIAEETLYYIEGVYYKHSPLKRQFLSSEE